MLAAAQAGLIVNVEKIVVDLGPDGRATRQIEIANTNDQPAEIKVFVSDWTQDENGAVDAVDGRVAKSPDSATGWIAVNPQRFVLNKGEKKLVTISFATPKEASQMSLKEYRSMIFTETAEVREQTAAPGREVHIRLIGRIGTKVFVRNPQGLAKLDCEVTNVAETNREGERGLQIKTANHGNEHIQSDGSKIAFRDANGATVDTLPISPFSILPGHQRTVFVGLPESGKSKLEKGKHYNALAVIDYGGSDLVAGEIELTY
jgi:P pilus assembly chaperone PapD